jgi:hypothetical protein
MLEAVVSETPVQLRTRLNRVLVSFGHPVWYLTAPLTLLGWKHLSTKFASAFVSCFLAPGRMK